MKQLVITGGSRGIGKATIQRFMSEGWQAINLSRTHCRIKGVININIDLSDACYLNQHSKQLADLCSNAETICLVHNAAYLQKDKVDSMSLQVLTQTMQVNVISPILLNQICLPFMKANSSIIYIGSALSEIAVAGNASYVISKHALIGLMRASCQDLASRNIRSVCIVPGFVNTQLLKSSIDDASIAWLINNKVIAKRLIEPEEIAELILNVAKHPLINGEVIHANLGHVST